MRLRLRPPSKNGYSRLAIYTVPQHTLYSLDACSSLFPSSFCGFGRTRHPFVTSAAISWLPRCAPSLADIPVGGAALPRFQIHCRDMRRKSGGGRDDQPGLSGIHLDHLGREEGVQPRPCSAATSCSRSSGSGSRSYQRGVGGPIKSGVILMVLYHFLVVFTTQQSRFVYKRVILKLQLHFPSPWLSWLLFP